jgi:hypothetical protein
MSAMNATVSGRAYNWAFIDHLNTPGMEKVSVDSATDFTRWKMREDGITRRVLSAIQVANEDLTRSDISDEPMIIVDLEPDSPGAISVAFAELPVNVYIKGPRYRVYFSRIVTPRFVKDIDTLRTWTMDIRQVLADNSIKDMLAEEDSKFLAAANTAMIGQDQVSPFTGTVQWQSISGGITPESWQEGKKILPRTPAHLEANTVLMNNVTVREMLKWGRDEMPADFIQNLAKNGWSESEYDNSTLIISLKRDLIPDDTMYYFGPENFIGKFYVLTDATMAIKRENYLLSFFAYETIGASIANVAAVGRADFV